MDEIKLFNDEIFDKDIEKKMFIEQYRNITNIIENSNSRRINVNSFFTGVLSAIVGFIGYLFSKDQQIEFLVILFILLFSYLLTILWECSIITYSAHNITYYNILQQMERKMPVKFYEYEWYKAGKFDWRISISKLENLLAQLFGLIILAFLTVSFIQEKIFSITISIIVSLNLKIISEILIHCIYSYKNRLAEIIRDN